MVKQLINIGHIDDPAELDQVGRYVRLKGWVITTDLEWPQLYVDNKFLGEIKPSIYREDVKQSYPDVNLPNPTGFDQLFTMPKLSTGMHTLFLEFKSSNSIKDIFSRQIKKLPPSSHNFFLRFLGDRARAHHIKYNESYDHTIKIVGVETSRVCNFHCDMCPAHSEKSRYVQYPSFSSESLLEKVLPFLKNYNYSIKRVDTGSVWGEPLVDNNFFKNTIKVIEACPNAIVEITTNGSLLNRPNIEKILDLEIIKRITISVDAGCKATYEYIRKGGKWETLIENISELIRIRNMRKLSRPLISTNFVAMKSNFRELPQYVEKMAHLGVDSIGVVNAHGSYSSDQDQTIFDFPGKINDYAEERERIVKETLSIKLPEGVPLHLPSFTPNRQSNECSLYGASTIIIGIEGGVYPCCVIQSLDNEKEDRKELMGNVFQEELKSIWNNEKYLNFRVKMLRGQVPSSICSSCPFFYGM